jgi:hypothetical protein
MQRKSAFSRRLPDLVTEELVSVLSKKGASFEFKQLFDVVYDRLKKRNAASGGEEMLRLRAYEKLQHLVSRNMVKKNGKKYKGLASLANAIAPEEPVPAPKPVAPAEPAKPAAVKKAPAKPAKPVAKAATKASAKPAPKKPAAKVAKPTKAVAVKKAPAKPAKTSSVAAKKPVKKAVVKAVKKGSK